MKLYRNVLFVFAVVLAAMPFILYLLHKAWFAPQSDGRQLMDCSGMSSLILLVQLIWFSGIAIWAIVAALTSHRIDHSARVAQAVIIGAVGILPALYILLCQVKYP